MVEALKMGRAMWFSHPEDIIHQQAEHRLDKCQRSRMFCTVDAARGKEALYEGCEKRQAGRRSPGSPVWWAFKFRASVATGDNTEIQFLTFTFNDASALIHTVLYHLVNVLFASKYWYWIVFMSSPGIPVSSHHPKTCLFQFLTFEWMLCVCLLH